MTGVHNLVNLHWLILVSDQIRNWVLSNMISRDRRPPGQNTYYQFCSWCMRSVLENMWWSLHSNFEANLLLAVSKKSSILTICNTCNHKVQVAVCYSNSLLHMTLGQQLVSPLKCSYWVVAH